MGPTREELQALFDGMSDEELERRVRARGLTETAHALALEEMARRNLAPPDAPAEEPARVPLEERHFVLLRRYTDLLDAETLRARLDAEGIPVLLAGANQSRAFGLFAPVTGGTRVEVPEEQAEAAREIMEAFNAGKLMVEEEPGLPVETPGDGFWATDRRRLREAVVIFLVLLAGGWMAFASGVNFFRTWRDDDSGQLLYYWPYLFPLLFVVAALLFALRSKWSLLLFALYLLGALGVQIAWSVMGEELIILGPRIVLVTGLILSYGLYQTAQGRWR